MIKKLKGVHVLCNCMLFLDLITHKPLSVSFYAMNLYDISKCIFMTYYECTSSCLHDSF